MLDCLESTWISSIGKYVDAFEQAFAAFTGAKHAISCSNGTTALHLALLGLGIRPGDEVILPTLTYVATANAVTYCGATPVLADSEPVTWNMDPFAVEDLITSRTKAIVVVHLYGHPVDMDPLLNIAGRHSLAVVEDAAEAHGATYKGRRVGGLGTVATFSFYGNKIITTGEGGMVVTSDDSLARKIRILRGQGQDPERRYWFTEVGYNYRMTNVCAALGLAQLEKVEWQLQRRRELASWYRELLGATRTVRMQPEMPWATNVYWLSSVVLESGFPLDRDTTMAVLRQWGIETRPFFYPLHVLPIYRQLASRPFPVAESLAGRGLNLPSHAGMTRDDVAYVAEALLALAAL